MCHSCAPVESSASSFNIHNALYFVKYTSRAAQNSPEDRGLKTPALDRMVNGKKVRGRKRYQMINIIINGLYEDTKRKAQKRVEWRMLSLQ